MSSTIVVGVDGSPGSDRALDAAAEVAKRYESSLVVCHVVERIAAKGDLAPLHADEPAIKDRIEGEAAKLREQGIETGVRFESIILGGPARSLADVAAETDADLIVVGTRGHSALAGVILGSVTQKLLHLAKCPVLCIPSKDA